MFLADRADLVKGHFCIGRYMKDSKTYVEYYNKGEWCAFGEVFTEEEIAIAVIKCSETKKGYNMSDHTVCLTVVLDKDYRVDDAEAIMNAIRMVKGVSSVDANVANSETYIAYARARTDLEKKLWEALQKDPGLQ